MIDEDDAALLARCVRGDTQAFEPLVRRYERVLFNVAFRMLGDPEDARDAAQTAFLKAWEKRDSYDRRYRFFSWLYRILVNECLNVRSSRSRKPSDPLRDEPAGGPDAGRAVEERELGERVQAALMGLTRDQREVVVLRHFAELSYAEIAETLQVPEKTVKSRLFSARRQLADVLAERGAVR